MGVYFSVQIKMKDPDIYNHYLEACDDVFSRFQGRYLAVDEAPTILEGEWPYTRSILIEFPSEKLFNEWYYSEAYQDILKYRLEGATCTAIIIHGQ